MLKEALIFANGVIEDYSTMRAVLPRAHYIIAADGGLKHIRNLGLSPDLVMGDLDSITSQDRQWLNDQKAQVFEFSEEKDETDLELALLEVLKRKFNKIRILGATGGRTDQTLANIFLLLLSDKEEKDIKMDDGREEIFLIKKKSVIRGYPGDIISLIPLLGMVKGVKTAGLQYPLSGETLYPEKSRGVSNTMCSKKASVQIEEGTLLCVHTRNLRMKGEKDEK